MADLPILNASNPTEIPAKVYDRVWIEQIIIRAGDPNGDFGGEVKLHKYGMFNGKAELAPGNGRWIIVENILAKSEEDADLQVAMNALIAYVAKLGVENDVVST